MNSVESRYYAVVVFRFANVIVQ